jgi:hypothetical protein
MRAPAARYLTLAEQLAFAGLLRVIARLDSGMPADKVRVMESVGVQLLSLPTEANGSPGHRPEAPNASDAPTTVFQQLLERADTELPHDEDVRTAAENVARPSARMAIFEALDAIVRVGPRSRGEQALLDWLVDIWAIDCEPLSMRAD